MLFDWYFHVIWGHWNPSNEWGWWIFFLLFILLNSCFFYWMWCVSMKNVPLCRLLISYWRGALYIWCSVEKEKKLPEAYGYIIYIRVLWWIGNFLRKCSLSLGSQTTLFYYFEFDVYQRWHPHHTYSLCSDKSIVFLFQTNLSWSAEYWLIIYVWKHIIIYFIFNVWINKIFWLHIELK